MLRVEATKVVNHSVIHRTALPRNEELSGPKCSGAAVEKS